MFKMELVYLWIKNYKNIKQLGCSLSADYEEFSNSYDVDNDFLSISLKT